MHFWCITRLIWKKIVDENNIETVSKFNEGFQKLKNAENYALTEISASKSEDNKEFVFMVDRWDSEILMFRMKSGFLEMKLDNNRSPKIIEVNNLSSANKHPFFIEDFIEKIRIRCIKCTTSHNLTKVEKELYLQYLSRIEKNANWNPENYENVFFKIGELILPESERIKNAEKGKVDPDKQRKKRVSERKREKEAEKRKQKSYSQKILRLKKLFDKICKSTAKYFIRSDIADIKESYTCIKTIYKNIENKSIHNVEKKHQKLSTEERKKKALKDQKENFEFSHYQTIMIDHHVTNVELKWHKSKNLQNLILKNWTPNRIFISWKTLEDGFAVWQKLQYLDLSNCKITMIPKSVIEFLPQSLKILNLSKNNLQKLPSVISHLQQLEVLSLSDNPELKDNGFPWEFLPESLEKLYLENTNLNIIQPTINRLVNLRTFAVSAKKLNIISWEEFPRALIELKIGCGEFINPLKDKHLKYLKKLQIFQLQNANLNINFWEKLPQSLQTIDLSNNKITVPSCHYYLPNLTSLILPNNSIRMIYWKNIAENLPNLTILDLENNNFCQIEIEHLTKLEVLILSKNKIESISGTNLPKALKELYLSNNPVTSINDIDELKNLITLKLKHLKLEKLSTGIQKLKKLQFLFLSSNCLTSLPQKFENLQQLKFLDISYNNFYCKLNQNFSQDLWDRLPKNLSTLLLSGNNVAELPCQLSKLPLNYLEARNCNIQHICPQLRKLAENENSQIFEPILFENDGIKILDVRNNPSLTNLSFVPEKIYDPPLLTEKPNIHKNFKEISFVVVTDISDDGKKLFKFQNNEKFKISKKKPVYDFSEKEVTNHEQLCHCCAQCGKKCGQDRKEIETMMVMDFCLATIDEKEECENIENDKVMILELPIKSDEEIRMLKMSSSWIRALKGEKSVFDCTMSKMLPEKWKTIVRTILCDTCIEEMKKQIFEFYESKKELPEINDTATLTATEGNDNGSTIKLNESTTNENELQRATDTAFATERVNPPTLLSRQDRTSDSYVPPSNSYYQSSNDPASSSYGPNSYYQSVDPYVSPSYTYNQPSSNQSTNFSDPSYTSYNLPSNSCCHVSNYQATSAYSRPSGSYDTPSTLYNQPFSSHNQTSNPSNPPSIPYYHDRDFYDQSSNTYNNPSRSYDPPSNIYDSPANTYSYQSSTSHYPPSNQYNQPASIHVQSLHPPSNLNCHTLNSCDQPSSSLDPLSSIYDSPTSSYSHQSSSYYLSCSSNNPPSNLYDHPPIGYDQTPSNINAPPSNIYINPSNSYYSSSCSNDPPSNLFAQPSNYQDQPSNFSDPSSNSCYHTTSDQSSNAYGVTDGYQNEERIIYYNPTETTESEFLNNETNMFAQINLQNQQSSNQLSYLPVYPSLNGSYDNSQYAQNSYKQSSDPITK